jgi:hypothetical protein
MTSSFSFPRLRGKVGMGGEWWVESEILGFSQHSSPTLTLPRKRGRELSAYVGTTVERLGIGCFKALQNSAGDKTR